MCWFLVVSAEGGGGGGPGLVRARASRRRGRCVRAVSTRQGTRRATRSGARPSPRGVIRPPSFPRFHRCASRRVGGGRPRSRPSRASAWARSWGPPGLRTSKAPPSGGTCDVAACPDRSRSDGPGTTSTRDRADDGAREFDFRAVVSYAARAQCATNKKLARAAPELPRTRQKTTLPN